MRKITLLLAGIFIFLCNEPVWAQIPPIENSATIYL